MQDHEYHQLADTALLQIEEAVEALEHVDIDFESASGILELIFPNQSVIIINKQEPLHQIWVATRENGHHFEYRDGQWIDNRFGSELWALLSDAASKQADTAVTLTPPKAD
ncbi:MAG: iron donor protein CyaY [Aliidiomarina sp.]|uniref:iron donor protein CyaY n=1 Tax=Aliidiomarina sp. TaxID=1872439 RepID=UPI0025BB3E01|nr:iron donor protein CyaY [Aliidiomarina sp.]MCH8500638.1 iron donor protein CyaY [Aliidiomarina sp.]